MSLDNWNASEYDRGARFVSDYGADMLPLLAPKAGDKILDVGCGDGALTEKIAASGADVIGVDASPAMVEAARQRGVDARVMRAEQLSFEAEFDAVFSNAALHWVLQPELAAQRMKAALRPGGRLIIEFGGQGCLGNLIPTLAAALENRGVPFETVNPWFFPASEHYRNILESSGFKVERCYLYPRPTPLPGDLRDWLRLFAPSMVAPLPESEHEAVFEDCQDQLRSEFCSSAGKWTLPYVRIRAIAHIA